MKPPLSARAAAVWTASWTWHRSSNDAARAVARETLRVLSNDPSPRIRAVATTGVAREAQVLDQDGGIVA